MLASGHHVHCTLCHFCFHLWQMSLEFTDLSSSLTFNLILYILFLLSYFHVMILHPLYLHLSQTIFQSSCPKLDIMLITLKILIRNPRSLHKEYHVDNSSYFLEFFIKDLWYWQDKEIKCYSCGNWKIICQYNSIINYYHLRLAKNVLNILRIQLKIKCKLEQR